MLAARPVAPGTGLQLAGGPPAVASPRAQHASQVTLALRAYVPGAVYVTPQSICYPTPTCFISAAE